MGNKTSAPNTAEFPPPFPNDLSSSSSSRNTSSSIPAAAASERQLQTHRLVKFATDPEPKVVSSSCARCPSPLSETMGIGKEVDSRVGNNISTTTVASKPLMKRSMSIRDQFHQESEQPKEVPVPPTQQRRSLEYLPRLDSQESHGGLRIPSYTNNIPHPGCSNHNNNSNKNQDTISPQYGFYINLTPPSPQKYHQSKNMKLTQAAVRLPSVPSSTEVSYTETEASSTSSASDAGDSSEEKSQENHQERQPASSSTNSSYTGHQRPPVVAVNPVFQRLLLQHQANRTVAIQSSGGASPRLGRPRLPAQQDNILKTATTPSSSCSPPMLASPPDYHQLAAQQQPTAAHRYVRFPTAPL